MRIFFNYVEAAALVFMAMTISSNSTAFTREDVTDRSKPIWTDFTIRLYSPYFAQTPFRGLNGALCTFGRSDYKDFTNFKAVEGGEPSAAYLAYLDDSLCGQTTDNQLYIFRAEQDTSNSPLTVESWQRSSVGVLGPDDRAKVVLEEETSAANPYGIMDVARNIIHKNGGHIYSWSSSSKRLNDGRIQYKQIAWAS
jgi:hypothetical protein